MGHVKGPLCGRQVTCGCGFLFTCKRKLGHSEPCSQRNAAACEANAYGIHVEVGK